METAQDGKEGIQKFDGRSFDMVITDYVMPVVTGEGVLQHILGSSRHYTHIIGMSDTPWLLQRTGFDLVLAKPFPLNKLVDSIRTLFIASMASESAA